MFRAPHSHPGPGLLIPQWSEGEERGQTRGANMEANTALRAVKTMPYDHFTRSNTLSDQLYSINVLTLIRKDESTRQEHGNTPPVKLSRTIQVRIPIHE